MDCLEISHRSFGSRRAIVLFMGLFFLTLHFPAQRAMGTAETKGQSLQEVYNEAKELAQSPQSREQAIARYRLVIETHQANERLYQAALRELGLCCEDSEQVQEVVPLLLQQTESRREMQERQAVLKEVIGKIRVKHPEAFRKVVAEMEAATQEERPRPAMPSKVLSDAILQRKDKDLRENGLAQLQEMLGPESSADQQKTALTTLFMSRSADFDRDPVRRLALPLLKSDDAQVRAWALRCVPILNPGPDDVAVVLPLADDPSADVRKAVGEALVLLGKGEHADQVVPALTRLLGDSDPEVIDATLRPLWGSPYVTPALEERVIQLSREPGHRSIAIYFALSTMPNKSVPVCKRLIEVIQDPLSKNDDRARVAWGLRGGVVEEAKPLVEAGLLAALPEETDQDARTAEFRALRRVATEKARPYLRSVLASEMESDHYKKLAQDILDDLNGKR